MTSRGRIVNAFCPDGHRTGLWFPAGEQRISVRLRAADQWAASDEFDLVRAWQRLHEQHQVGLHICVAAALRRGVVDEAEASQQGLPCANLQPGFTLSGLGTLAEAALTCDRVVQF